MADLPSRSELFSRWESAALAVPATRIARKEIERPGSDANLLAAASSVMGEEIVNRMARAVAGCFEDTASGPQLDRVIFDRKALPRLPAAPSVGSVTLQRPTNAGGAGTIQGGLPGSTPSPTRIQTNQGVVYILTQSVSFGALDLGPFTATIQAQIAGVAQEVDANQVWSFIDTVFDGSVTIANAAPTAGGADEETDAQYKARAKAFFPTLRRGTLAAIQFGLLSTPGIASATVIEAINNSGLPANVVQAFILDPLGNSNPTLAARGLQTLTSGFPAGTGGFRAGGIPVVITGGTPTFINIRILLSFDSAVVLNTAQAADDVRTAIISALNNQVPGQPLFRTTILAAARSIAGVIVEDVNLIAPAGTLIPATPDITFRTRRELIATV